MSVRILRIKEVTSVTGLSRSTVYKRAKEGTFPKPVDLGGGLTGWVESEVQEMLLELIQERDSSD